MKAVLKLVVGLMSLLLLVAITVAVLFSTMVNSNMMKNQISQYVKTSTGRDLLIKGSLHASFWPRLGITVDDVSLSNPAGFKDDTFLFAHKLTISAELAPLLHRQLAVNRASLSDAIINLQKNAQGQTNWNFSSDEEKKSGSTEKLNTQESMQFNIAALSLSHTTINYSDAKTQQHYSLENVNITADNLSSSHSFPLNGSFTFISDTKSKTTVNVKTVANYESTNSKLSLKNSDIRLKPEKSPEIAIKGNIQADLNSSVINFLPLNMEMGDLKIQGDLSGNYSSNNFGFYGHIASNSFNLKRLLASSNKSFQLGNSNSLSNVSFTADLQINSQKVTLKAIHGNVDGHSLSGQLDYSTSPSHLGFTLTSDQLVLENYLPGGSSSKSDENNAAEKNSSGSLVIDGTIELGHLTYDVYQFSHLKTNLKYASKRLDLQNFSAGIFGGSTNGLISINFAGSAPSFTIRQRMSGVSAEQMLRTLTGSSKLNGIATLNVDINASGKSSSAIKQSLSGAITFNISNGAVYGTDIDYKVEQAISKISKQNNQTSDRGNTPFTHLTGTASFSQGNCSNPDLELLTPTLKIQAKGNYNLLSSNINYKLTCRLLQPHPINTEISGTKIDADLSNYDIPTTVGCTLQSPCVSVDLGGVLKILAVEGAKAVAKTAVKKELLKHVDENLGNVINKLLEP